jgi:predicted ATPase/class 3 adenylate cyclase
MRAARAAAPGLGRAIVVADSPSTLPTGTVTFLFTDVEGSTRLMDELGADRYAAALGEHRRSLREIFERHGGTEVDTQGDAFFVAFNRATDAVAASDEVRRELPSNPLRVRVGLHTGEPRLTADGYVGLDVARAARIAAAAHGGQVVLSETTRELLEEDVVLRDLGRHRLKDLAEPMRLYQLGVGYFPPLHSLNFANLPVQGTPLVGRERELLEVAELLQAHRLLTLTGAGGSGKTRLALQVAAEAVDEFSEGIFWVPLQALREPEFVLPTIAQAVGARNGLADHLGERRVLIVLDNLEQLIPAAVQLSDLLAQAPNAKIVGTSREPLRIRAEREYAVAPLTERDAITLFVERAQAVRPDFAGSDAVGEICRRLDCLPLAVELAAARVTVLSPEAILGRLGRRLPLLTHGPRDAPAKQRALRATIDWSYELLSEEEQRVFGRLAVFAGGWALDAAEIVCEADIDTLQALTEKNLIRAEGDRFSMLETIHEYARERLDESEDVQDVHERHARVFTELAERARGELGGAQRAESIGRLTAESANIRAAAAWASERRPDLLRRIAVSLRVFWNMHGYLREGRTWLERSLEVAPDGVQRAELLGGVGWICHSMGDREGALRAAEERLELARTLDDPKNLSGALGLLAVLADERGDPEEAEKLHLQCISISLAQGGAGRPERHRGNYAEFLLRQQRYDEAAELLHECLAAARERGDAFLVGRYTADLGTRELLQGRPASALPLLGEGVRMLHDLGDRWVTVYCLPLLADTFAALGADAKGARLVGAAETLLKTTELALWSDAGPVGVRRFEQTIAVLRAALGDETFAALRAEGAAMSVDEAVEYALSEVD